jgi:hypothetical protein
LRIAEASDHDASERPSQKADTIGRECGEEGSRWIGARKELGRNKRGKIGIDAEIVPLEQGV